MGKGSGRRPGSGFEANWEIIFNSGGKSLATSKQPEQKANKPTYEELEKQVERLKSELKRLQEDAVWERM